MSMEILKVNGHPPQEPIPSARSCYREAAAWNLYEMVRPDSGLRWHVLTEQQKEGFRTAIDLALALTDRTTEVVVCACGAPYRRTIERNPQTSCAGCQAKGQA